MVRWRSCLVLAMLLLLPARIGSNDDEDDDRGDEGDEDDDDDEDDDEEEHNGKLEQVALSGRRAPPMVPRTPRIEASVTRTIKKRPIECYVCAYKTETPLRACLDPTKYRVHTITCHSLEDKCFTSVISKGKVYDAVVRGCRSGCVGSTETTCCELNRCNNQAFTMPILSPPTPLSDNSSKTNKTIPPNIVFFITILLVLQTVVKVSFV